MPHNHILLMYLLIRQTVLTGVKHSFEYLTVFPGGCGKEGGEGGWERGGGRKRVCARPGAPKNVTWGPASPYKLGDEFRLQGSLPERETTRVKCRVTYPTCFFLAPVFIFFMDPD